MKILGFSASRPTLLGSMADFKQHMPIHTRVIMANLVVPDPLGLSPLSLKQYKTDLLITITHVR